MTTPSEWSPTLNLKVGEKIFPVKKTVLLEKLRLFQNDPSLLRLKEYEVQTKVSPSVFSVFVRMIDGDPTNFSVAILEPFRLLAEEFGFDSFASDRCYCDSSSDTWVSEEELESALPCVRIFVKSRWRIYQVIMSYDGLLKFANALRGASPEEIVIDGMEKSDRLLDKAVATVYSNTVAALPDGPTKAPFLAFVLWELHFLFYLCSIDTAMYCLNQLDELAPTGFDKAKLLLLSQCDCRHVDSFVPLEDRDWGIIRQALLLLQREKNGKSKEANELLGKLKNIGEYKGFLVNWQECDRAPSLDCSTGRSNNQDKSHQSAK
jgi:hypothetical protein